MSTERKWFGTDGIRAKYGTEPMTPEFIWRVGRAAAINKGGKKAAPQFIVGRDTRASGPVLEDALCRGLLAGGGKVTRLGVLPSGAVSMLVSETDAQGGAMISASHNSHEDNGIKFFDAKGFKLSDKDELAIERGIARAVKVPALSRELPTVPEFDAEPIYSEMYRAALHRSVPDNFSLQGINLVLDAGNGAAWNCAPYILKRYGAATELLACEPDGENINLQCGSVHPEKLSATVGKRDNAIGIALDGDADRLIMTDEDGEPLDGDEILAIVGTHLIAAGKLPKKTLVATVMSNLGLDEAIRHAGGEVARTAVGDRYVLERMLADGLTVGGEQSGHFMFLEHAPSGDGLLSALQVLNVRRETGKPLRELRRVMKKFPQKLYNLPVRKKKPLENVPPVRDAIAAAETLLAGTGRVFVRYSGTENKLRVLVEAPTEKLVEKAAAPVVAAIKEELSA